jgi:YgiT-type zinc finger domain-containing protein
MNCLICKHGIYAPGIVTVKLERDAAIILIKNVKAEVCDTCGNYLLDQSTTRQVLELAEERFSTGTELEVIKLKAA